MTVQTVLLIVAWIMALSTAMFGVALFVRTARGLKRESQALTQATERAAVKKGHAEPAGDELQQAAQALEEQKHLAREATDRADRFFRCIEKIEKERNDWFAAYEFAVNAHQNAQQALFSDLERLGKRLQAIKKIAKKELALAHQEERAPLDALARVAELADASLSPVVSRAVQEFASIHGEEGLRKEIRERAAERGIEPPMAALPEPDLQKGH